MLINDSVSHVAYTYSGVNTFSVNFAFFTLSSIKVGYRVPTTGIDFSDLIMLTPGTDYSVAGTAAPDLDSYQAYLSGTVTLTSAGAAKLVTGDYVTIYRDTAIEQQYQYEELDSFPAKSHENALTRLTAIAQELQGQLDRALVLPLGAPSTTEDLIDQIYASAEDMAAAAASADAAAASADAAAASADEAAASAASISVGTAGGICGLDDDALVDAVNLPVASNAGAGIVELATSEEAVTATDTTKALTPASSGAALFFYLERYGHGECRLATSGSNLALNRVGLGRMFFPNGGMAAVPVAGVTLSPSGLSADTTYLIYAYLNAGAMTLEASTTAWTADATTGIPIKTGDASRVLVGMARTTAATAWIEDPAKRFVLSYWNRKEKTAQGALSAEVNVTSTTPVELNTNARAYFLTWGDEIVGITGNSCANNNVAGNGIYFSIGVDGTTVAYYAGCTCNAPGNGYRSPMNITKKGVFMSEGVHYITPCGYVSAGTGNFSYTGIAPTVVNAFIKG